MLEKNQSLSFSAEFSKNIENWVKLISKDLNINLWIELVPFLPKHSHQEQREFLRRAMIHMVTEKIQNTEIQTHSHSLPNALLALNSLYKPGRSLKEFPLVKFSISHCKNYGVFACSPRENNDHQFIGVDLEINVRVTKEIINRVSTPVEVFDAPSAVQLWTAKEASFKSLIENKTQLLSDLLIHSWTPLVEGKPVSSSVSSSASTASTENENTPLSSYKSWQYQFANTQQDKKYTGKGWVISFTDYTLAFSYLNNN